jgi:DNA polymerase III sliding clamp (beta) subunit (PCNA family)
VTKVTFETAAFADSIKKANAIAPTRGKEFDKYKGFHLEVRPEGNNVCLRSTNGDVFYTEFMTPLKIEGDEVDWRIPSAVTNGIVSNLPIGSGKMVTFENEKGFLRITSARMRARVPLIANDYYPDWESFDANLLPVVENFGARLDQVAWAADRGNLPPLNGVYIDSGRMVATNKVRIATVPIEFDTGGDKYVVVPVGILAPVVRGMEEIKVGIIGNYLCVSPNDDTQIKCVLYADPYPPVDKPLSLEFEQLVMLNRDLVVETLARVLAVGSSDRQLPLKVVIGDEQIAFHVRDENNTEEIEDSIYLAGQCEHEPVEYLFSPENFSDAISKSPNKEMIFHYNTSEQDKGTRFEGGSGYVVIVRPRVKTSNGSGSSE